jgi:glycosyltransferase involved in cell wall biosynthesis
MSVLAVMTARNEAGYIGVTLRTLIEQGLEVVLIDHESIDGTRELAESYLGRGLLRIETLKWRGTYDLTALLVHQQEVFATASHDWLVRIDADEWLHPNVAVPLAEYLERHVDPRYGIVNFREYVFLPPTGVDMFGEDYRKLATTYYAFVPGPMRLMRAWRNGVTNSFVGGAGHRLDGIDEAIVLPEDQALRHYVGLSWSHAIAKRADRTYAPHDLEKGWHFNRLDMRAARPISNSAYLKRAEPWDTPLLDASMPSRVHFWDPGFG